MKAKGIFISTLLVIDTFLVSYAAGFHSRHVLVINPKLPPVVQKKEEKPAPVAAPVKKTDDKGAHDGKADSHSGKTHGKGAHKSKEVPIQKGKGKTAGTSPKSTDDSKVAGGGESSPPKKSASKPAAKPVAKPATTTAPKSGNKSTPRQLNSYPKNPGA